MPWLGRRMANSLLQPVTIPLFRFSSPPLARAESSTRDIQKRSRRSLGRRMVTLLPPQARIRPYRSGTPLAAAHQCSPIKGIQTGSIASLGRAIVICWPPVATIRAYRSGKLVAEIAPLPSWDILLVCSVLAGSRTIAVWPPVHGMAPCAIGLRSSMAIILMPEIKSSNTAGTETLKFTR